LCQVDLLDAGRMKEESILFVILLKDDHRIIGFFGLAPGTRHKEKGQGKKEGAFEFHG
jgi:hypothetical protein